MKVIIFVRQVAGEVIKLKSNIYHIFKSLFFYIVKVIFHDQSTFSMKITDTFIIIKIVYNVSETSCIYSDVLSEDKNIRERTFRYV